MQASETSRKIAGKHFILLPLPGVYPDVSNNERDNLSNCFYALPHCNLDYYVCSSSNYRKKVQHQNNYFWAATYAELAKDTCCRLKLVYYMPNSTRNDATRVNALSIGAADDPRVSEATVQRRGVPASDSGGGAGAARGDMPERERRARRSVWHAQCYSESKWSQHRRR